MAWNTAIGANCKPFGELMSYTQGSVLANSYLALQMEQARDCINTTITVLVFQDTDQRIVPLLLQLQLPSQVRESRL